MTGAARADVSGLILLVSASSFLVHREKAEIGRNPLEQCSVRYIISVLSATRIL